MAIFKCKMCAGELEILKDLSICECEFCGTKQTIPKVKDENIQTLFNRANNLRMKAEFDKASEIYEKIIQSNEEEAEAYWGLILCKYGIEYVEDPATFKRVPTCNRTSFEAIVADEDYKLAIEYADASQKEIYENEAKAIDEIQKGILALASREEPYDIFICYKEKDSEGKRTQDSVMANDIYYQLTQEGYRVFYAAITLEDKIGKEYEPYIFSALNSSKVMLTLGTKPEYFNAVWVKNEWSRFLKIMKKDRSRMLIPCYRDMDAYDLPEEFAHLQAQDMSKIGFINDLVRGIKKVVVKEDEKNNASQAVVQTGGYSANIVALLKRGNIALEDGEWEKADGFFEEVLNQDATNGEAYLGKLLTENKCSNLEKLKEKYIEKYELATEGEVFEACKEKKEYICKQADIYSVPVYYKKEKIITEYQFDRMYLSYYNERVKQKEEQLLEMNSNKLLNRCKQYCADEVAVEIENIFLALEEILEKRIEEAKENDKKTVEKITNEYIKFVEDTDEKVNKISSEAKVTIEKIYTDILTEMSKASSEENYNIIKKKISSLGGYKDSASLIEKCDDEIRKIKFEEEERITKARNRKRNIQISVLSIMIIVIIAIIWEKPIRYNIALGNKKIGNYDKAYELFTKLGEYSDSKEQAADVFCLEKYHKALLLKGKGKNEEAYQIFKELGDYKNSQEFASETLYIRGLELKEQGKNEEAYQIFKELGDYKNSQEFVSETLYIRAIELKEQGKNEEAYKLFRELGDYEKSGEMALEMFLNTINSKNIYDEVEFSSYNGVSKYILIAKEEKRALLLSKNTICDKAYDTSSLDVTWEKCSLRAWLNEEYYNKAFANNEKMLILEAKLDNSNNIEYGTEGGMDTIDKVFLLSLEESNKYFKDDSFRKTKNIDDVYRSWWLRSPGKNERCATFVSSSGSVNTGGIGVAGKFNGVRPAVWVKIKN